MLTYASKFGTRISVTGYREDVTRVHRSFMGSSLKYAQIYQLSCQSVFLKKLPLNALAFHPAFYASKTNSTKCN